MTKHSKSTLSRLDRHGEEVELGQLPHLLVGVDNSPSPLNLTTLDNGGNRLLATRWCLLAFECSVPRLHFSCYSPRITGEGHRALALEWFHCGAGNRTQAAVSAFWQWHLVGAGNTVLKLAVPQRRSLYSVHLVIATANTVSRVFFPEEYVFQYPTASFSIFLV